MSRQAHLTPPHFVIWPPALSHSFPAHYQKVTSQPPPRCSFPNSLFYKLSTCSGFFVSHLLYSCKFNAILFSQALNCKFVTLFCYFYFPVQLQNGAVVTRKRKLSQNWRLLSDPELLWCIKQNIIEWQQVSLYCIRNFLISKSRCVRDHRYLFIQVHICKIQQALKVSSTITEQLAAANQAACHCTRDCLMM